MGVVPMTAREALRGGRGGAVPPLAVEMTDLEDPLLAVMPPGSKAGQDENTRTR
jgi:hypothetical protein